MTKGLRQREIQRRQPAFDFAHSSYRRTPVVANACAAGFCTPLSTPAATTARAIAHRQARRNAFILITPSRPGGLREARGPPPSSSSRIPYSAGAAIGGGEPDLPADAWRACSSSSHSL